jgi:hypothetical protein
MDEDRVAKILIAYQRSFLDALVDKWATTWIENRLGKDRQEKKSLNKPTS